MKLRELLARLADRENLARLAAALSPIRPRLRGVPGDLPFVLDEASLRSGLDLGYLRALRG